MMLLPLVDETWTRVRRRITPAKKKSVKEKCRWDSLPPRNENSAHFVTAGS
jgi:hypothetical protein